MRTARFWHRAEASTPDTLNPGLDWTRMAWGWSDDSPEAARAHAEQRARGVVERVARADMSGDDWGDWYEYAERVLPELVVETIPDAEGNPAGVVTINRYGATILNTAHLAIVDVDLPGRRNGPPSLAGMVLRSLFGRPLDASRGDAHGAEAKLIEHARAWVEADASRRGVRVYRTAGGLRHILVSPPLDPVSPEADRVMEAMRADPLYRRLCKAQRCYRARLTPKPWRLGMRAPCFTHATLTSDDPDVVATVQSWLKTYEERSERHDVCRLLHTFGHAEARDPVAARLIDLHDTATLGDTTAALA